MGMFGLQMIAWRNSPGADADILRHIGTLRSGGRRACRALAGGGRYVVWTPRAVPIRRSRAAGQRVARLM